MQWGPRKYPNEFWINSVPKRPLTWGITPVVIVFYPFPGKKAPATYYPKGNKTVLRTVDTRPHRLNLRIKSSHEQSSTLKHNKIAMECLIFPPPAIETCLSFPDFCD